MRKTMGNLFRAALALLVVMAVPLLSVPALAATADTIELAENGTVTVVSGHAAEELLSSVQVRIRIAPAEGQSVGFTFSAGLADRLTRYSYTDGTLSVYVAGTAPLLAAGQDRFVLGAVTGGDVAGAALPEDALQFVYGRRVVAQSVELVTTEAVPTDTPAPEETAVPEDTPVPAETPEPAPTPESQARTGLRAALDTAKGYDAAGYTPVSFQALQEAIQSAEEALADPAASEAAWTAAGLALQKAIDKLVPVASADGSGPVIGDGQDDGTGAGEPEPGPTVSETFTTAPPTAVAATQTPAPTDEPAAPAEASEPTVTPEPTATATAAPSGGSNAPGTGDEANALFWLAALCVSGLLLTMALRKLKRCR